MKVISDSFHHEQKLYQGGEFSYFNNILHNLYHRKFTLPKYRMLTKIIGIISFVILGQIVNFYFYLSHTQLCVLCTVSNEIHYYLAPDCEQGAYKTIKRHEIKL